MKRWGEFLGFAAVATALHLGLVILVLPDLDGAEAGGIGGEAIVTLQGAPDQVEEMIKEWTRPPVQQTDAPQMDEFPDTVDDTPQMAALTLDNAPDTSTQIAALSGEVPDPALPIIPRQAPPTPPEMFEPVLQQAAPRSAPDPRPQTTADVAPRPMARPTAPRKKDVQPPRPPKADIQPAETPKPKPKPDNKPKPKPKAKPKAKPKPKAKAGNQNRAASAGSATQKAAGAGGSNQAGNAGNSKVKALGKGKEAKLKSIWGSKIRTRIERRKKAPRGAKGKGVTTLALRIAPSGQLISVSVAKSSGVPALDQAAVAAVKRAGKFPKAPKELNAKSYRFNVAIRMK